MWLDGWSLGATLNHEDNGHSPGIVEQKPARSLDPPQSQQLLFKSELLDSRLLIHGRYCGHQSTSFMGGMESVGQPSTLIKG